MDNGLENELVERARKGDPAAGPFLVSYLGDHLLGYARAIAPDLGDVERERIVEIAIEAGVRSINRFDPNRGSLRPWFRRQVQWKTSEWRRSGPPTSAPLPPELAATPEDSPRLPEVVSDSVGSAIAELSSDDRLLLALRLTEGLPHAEIAIRMGISNDSARQRYRRALSRLRELIERRPELVTYLTERGVA